MARKRTNIITLGTTISTKTVWCRVSGFRKVGVRVLAWLGAWKYEQDGFGKQNPKP